MYRNRTPSKTENMTHLGTALLPMVALTAVPNTPPPTPPLPPRKKNIFGKRKKRNPSPIIPAIAGLHRTGFAIGMGMPLDLDTPQSSQGISMNGSYSDEEVGYASIQRGQHEIEEDFSDENDFVLETPVEIVSSTPLGQASKEVAYAHVRKSPRSTNLTPENISTVSQKKSALANYDESLSSVKGMNAKLQKRQQDLEKRMKQQNEETKGIVLEMMKHQHNSSIKQDKALKEFDNISGELEYFEQDRDKLLNENARLIKRNSDLVKKDKDLLQLANLLKVEDVDGRGALVKQVQEIMEESDMLKETVHRLNIELSRFQAKYGDTPISSKEASGLPSKGARPQWLTDTRYLTPLFVSYDAQLKEKDEIIAEYSVQLKELKQQFSNIVKENEILHSACEQVKAEPFVSQEKWNNMKEQNSLMVEEIQILVQQLEMSQEKAKKNHQTHASEVCELSKRLAVIDAENQLFKEENNSLKKSLDELSKEHEKMIVESFKKIPAVDHVAAINACKRDYSDMEDNYKYEMQKLFKKIEIAEGDKKEALLEITERKSEVKQLEGKLKATEKALLKMQDQEEKLQNELTESNEKGKECERHLAEVVRVAEKIMAEKQALGSLIEKEQRVAHSALQKSMRGKWEMEQMQKTLLQYKKESSGKMNDISQTIGILQENHENRINESNREVAHLRHLLQEKQMKVEKAAEEKRMLEVQLESVWQAATNENKMIMSALYKSNVL